jgi:uncharacterized protein (TIGR02996 family)
VCITALKDDFSYTELILERPDDEGLRLAYAQWLEQRGNPRGEFIRIQCQLSHLSNSSLDREQLQSRAAELLGEYELDWCDPLSRMATRWEWERGFVSRIEMKVKQFKHLRELSQLFPLQHLTLVGPFTYGKPRMSSIAQCAALSRLRSFELCDGYYAVGAQEIDELMQSPYISNLHQLGLFSHTFGVAGTKILAATVQLQNIQSLGISCYGCNESDFLGSEGLRIILESRQLAAVTFLSLRRCRLDDSSCEMLAGLARTQSFTGLDLSYNSIGEAGLSMLMKSDFLKGIQWIDLRHNAIHKKAAKNAKERFGSVVLLT